MVANNKILVDVDPTADTHPAVERAIWLAKAYGADLELFICEYDPYLAGDRFSDSTGLQKARDSLLKERRNRLEKLAATAEDAGVSATVDVVWDHPIDEAIIRKVHSSQPLMVVKDTHYHPVLKRTIFSNTDWGLIRECPASLMLVKPKSFGEPVRILAAVDPLHHHDKPAELDQLIMSIGQEMASRSKGELSVFHCFDPTPAIAGASTTMATPIAVPVSEVTEALEQQHKEAMEKLCAGYDVPRDRVHIHQGTPEELLPELADQQRTDVVVMGAVSRRGLKRIFIGHTAERVLDRLPCDLVIVKPSGFSAALQDD